MGVDFVAERDGKADWSRQFYSWHDDHCVGYAGTRWSGGKDLPTIRIGR